MMTLPGLLVAGALSAFPAWATETRTVYVDCAAAAGGDGSQSAPYDTIGAGVAAGRALAVGYNVLISVAAGVCQNEAFPILLDYKVVLRGARSARFDGEGFPIDGQYVDTVVTWATLPDPIPPGVVFLVITGDDVKVSQISIDGKVPPQDDVFAPAARGPIGISVRGADGFVVGSVRIVGAGDTALGISGSTGVVASSYIRSATGNGMFAGGGDPVATVTLLNNRIVYRTNGLPAAGGILASATVPAGLALELVAVRNDFATTATNTGPSNPAAIRLTPSLGSSLDGTLEAWFLWNRISGPARFSLMLQAGSSRWFGPTGPHATGAMAVMYAGTTLDASAALSSVPLITFTAARSTQIPCELNPNLPPGPACPTLNPTTPFYSEYLEGAVYDLWHGGEFDGAQIDHPEFAPYDGHELDNLLLINGEIADYETFVVVPQP